MFLGERRRRGRKAFSDLKERVKKKKGSVAVCVLVAS